MSGEREPGEAVAGFRRRAREYVAAHGDARDLLRLAVLQGEAPPQAFADALAPWQGPAGGFVPLDRPPHPAQEGIEATRAALCLCDEVGLHAGPLVERAAGFLARVQRPDGAWHETPAPGANLPPEDPFVLTAGVAGQLVKLRCASPRTLQRAEAWLMAAFRPERVEGDPAALEACAQLFSNGPFEDADEVLQWCGRALEKGYRSGQLAPTSAARTLLACDAVALPGGRVDAGELVLALLGSQAPDGAVAGPERPTRERVECTLVALRALLRFERAGAAPRGAR